MTLQKDGSEDQPEHDPHAELARLIRDGKLEEAQALLDPLRRDAPKDPRLLHAAANIAQGRGDVATALAHVETLLALTPDHAPLRIRRAFLLFETGQDAQALAQVSELVARNEANANLLVRAAVSLGSSDPGSALADTYLAAALEHSPENPAVFMALAERAARREGPEGALAWVRRGLRARPGHAGLLGRWIRLLRASASPEEVIEAIDSSGQGHLAVLRIERALSLRQAGHIDRALAELEAVSAEEKFSASVTVHRAATLLLAGRIAEACAVAGDACKTWPDLLVARREYARALAASGRCEAAIDALEQALARFGHDANLLCDRAGLLLQLERYAEARKALDQVASQDPRHERALIMLVDLLTRTGEPKSAADTLSDVLADRMEASDGGGADFPTTLGLRFVELADPFRGDAIMQKVTARLLESLPRLSEGELLRLMAAVASREDGRNEATVLRELVDRPVLSGTAAARLMRHILSRVGANLAWPVAQSLLARVRPDDWLLAYLGIAALVDSPDAALAGARAGGRRRAGRAEDATLIGQLLRQSGRPRTAARYLARAATRWPQDPELAAELAEALLHDNQGDAALACLDRLEAAHPAFAARRGRMLRARFLLYLGRLEDSLSALSAISDPKVGELRLRLDLLIWLGDLDAAERALADFLSSPWLNARHKAHFSSGLSGAQLTDLRLCRMLEQTGQDFDRFQFFAHVREAVARWRASPARPAPSPGAIPATVIQYWDAPDVPDEVAVLMRTWQSASGVRHERYDRSTARAWLAEACGQDWARAFRNARHAAEQADLFRLARLAVSGGIYADADDRRVGGLDGLLQDGAGAVLFVEPSGCVANNFMAARPGHPLIRMAAEAARDALLSRDNENVWFKTGPGLMTRVTARYIADCQDAGETPDLRLGDTRDLARVVQFHVRLGYKVTPAYWNTTGGVLNVKPVLDALVGAGRVDVA